MASIMTKRGNLDNVVTYEHYCDTTADLDDIDPYYITLGSVAVVLVGDSGGLEVYMATSDKEWIKLGGAGSGSNQPSSSDATSDIVGTGSADNMTLKE